jgi:hypothetical protein
MLIQCVQLCSGFQKSNFVGDKQSKLEQNINAAKQGNTFYNIKTKISIHYIGIVNLILKVYIRTN